MKEIQIGEVWIHGDDLYFHSDRPGGKGGFDIWVTSFGTLQVSPERYDA